jgi:polyhydroxybutyrate depolymerase
MLMALVAVGILGCKGDVEQPRVGSETGFLSYCSGDCGEGLSCLCGVCTRACTGTNECSGTSTLAECVSVPSGPGSGATSSCAQGATCDLTCLDQADCVGLGSQYRCEAGFCRKGDQVCPAMALPPGDREREVVVGGVTRTYAMHVPVGYAGDAPVPLVLDFHPMGTGAALEQTNSGFRELSDAQGFIAVWPQGIDNTWDVGPCCSLSTPVDDLSFARAIVRQLSSEACVDPRRVYAAGLSLGGAMAYYLACQHAEVFAAIAASSMDLFVDSEIACNPSRAVTEISFRGSADTVVPYAGGSSTVPGQPDMVHSLLGAVGTFEKWASLNQCTGSPSAADANGCSTYSNCKDGSEVTLCTIDGGGQVMGDAARAWEMLAKHPMP